MLTEPKIVERDAQPYLGIREMVPIEGIPAMADRAFPELLGWVGAHGVALAGAPFLRYNVTGDMRGDMEIEAGVPVATAAPVGGRVRADALPAGRYATLTHTGPFEGLFDANAALQRWAAERGLAWKKDGERWGARLEIYHTDPREEPDQQKWQTEVVYQLTD